MAGRATRLVHLTENHKGFTSPLLFLYDQGSVVNIEMLYIAKFLYHQSVHVCNV